MLNCAPSSVGFPVNLLVICGFFSGNNIPICQSMLPVSECHLLVLTGWSQKQGMVEESCLWAWTGPRVRCLS